LSLSKNGLRFSPFSHIYVEEEAFDFPITREILSKFEKSRIISIYNYKEVFARPRQNYNLQKKAVKLILAVKKGQFLFGGPEVCHNFGFENFYYTSPILNCPYNCSYCFLKGMYPSSNMVIFVNIEDFFKEIEKLLKEKKKLYIAASYETDLLALERIVPYTRFFIDFSRKKEDLLIEIRTKSANFNAVKDVLPSENIILSWTLSTEKIASKYEKNAPDIKKRIKSIKEAQERGYKIRICFDPLIFYEDFEKDFKHLTENVFNNIDPERVYDIGLGVFRIPSDYLKNIRARGIYDEIFYYPYEEGNKVYSVEKNIKDKMLDFSIKELSKFLPKEKIFYL